jgi:hypothetical protein
MQPRLGALLFGMIPVTLFPCQRLFSTQRPAKPHFPAEAVEPPATRTACPGWGLCLNARAWGSSLFGQRSRSAVAPHDPRGIKAVPLIPPPVDRLLGRKNRDPTRSLDRPLLRLRRCMYDPRPLSSAGCNLDLVPNAPMLHDAAPNKNKAHLSF